MDFVSMVFIALSVCIDDFALSMAYSLQAGAQKKQALGKVLLIFPIIQMILALVGWLAGTGLAQFIDVFDHWIAFGLLSFIGIKLMRESILEMREHKEENDRENGESQTEAKECEGECHDTGCSTTKAQRGLTVMALIGVALATSTDSLAVGLTYALLEVNIAYAVL